MADILIRGMEMPESCAECYFKYVAFYGKVKCDLAGHDLKNYKETGYRDDCPLISLPKGHGRLIDGDELASGCDAPHWCRWLSEIEDAPTVVPAEVEVERDG